ncbi:SGNH/GDSL hydrolase family protein [Yoonia litorea]|uniref:Lysophospholipase L1 n=1 Tax=Yoonia litorea TaxID=1123755 RepID=A0A1I6N1U7_9RHOB|nr:SGNH/GDSL hydrolase family protein [Yoonia litorea]SFS21945.1 Lysophospholipase L1 [Yoonia litorea]
MRPDLIALTLLAPVLLGQAFFVRRGVQVLPEATGERIGQAGEGPPLRLLVIGDSSAAGVGVRSQDRALLGQLVSRLARRHQIAYTLVAKSGARTADGLAWIDDIPGAFDVAVTAFGVNDVTKGTSLPAFVSAQQQLWERLKSAKGVGQVLVSGMPPLGQFPALPQPMRWVLGARATRFGAAQEQAAVQAEAVTFVKFSRDLVACEMAADGFHPGPTVYADWAEAVAERIALKRPVA